MKILHLITGLEYGGSQTMLVELAIHFQQRGIENRVVSMTQRSPLADRLALHNIPSVALGMSRGRPSLLGFRALLQMIRQEKPDIIQTWMYHADLAGGLAGFLSRIPVVWGIHHTLGNAHTLKQETWTVVRINRMVSGWLPDKIACCSQSTYDSHLSLGFAPAKMALATNGVDVSRFLPLSGAHAALCARLGLPDSSVLVGHCGRFHPSKGHEVFLQAMGLLQESHPNVHFVLCGSGIEWSNPELAGWITRENLQSRVHLLGLQADMANFLPGLDILVSNSHDEALPLLICEAMSCQVPCVVTDVGDQAQVVAETGVCVRPGDASALASGCVQFLSISPESLGELGRAARARIVNHYSLENTAAQYLSIYHQVLGGAGGD